MIISNIKAIMEEKKVTYAELEKATGLSSQTVTRIRGEMICKARLETLETVALVLGVKVKDLFSEKFG